ncbi:WD repeat protein [Aspergillus luchuensis]|uniref:WD repeat protein n=1 Tax=Aspergillus kawachii TaxID=1069201 RepID=A0A146G176_ASPKA|nr:WD repeat protein [Aspergillus luchuensis]
MVQASPSSPWLPSGSPNQSGKSTSLSRHTGSALAFTRFSQAEKASVGRPVKTLQLWASTTSVARWRETLKLGPDVSPLSE